ncbi:MAG: oligosaccharide flippase family protein [Eubacterium sp.]|nr:oligosaccharide flippase family protein [Eubacterium sp.]
MLNRHPLIKGALVLTFANVITRATGFLYRIFLSNLIGAEGMGLFQLIFPVIGFCTALSCGGIQIAVSRFVAETKSKSRQYAILISSLLMSLVLSLGTTLFVFHFSKEISIHLIQNEQCTRLLQYAIITIPMVAVHSCICGFYLGRKKAAVPAWSMLVEQLVKIIAVYLLGIIWIHQQIPITPMLAVYSTIISELGGMIFCVIALSFEKSYPLNPTQLIHSMKDLFSVSYILTLNRILLTFLQCLEAIFLPLTLEKSGLSTAQSLALYGILTGMALPVVTFPSAINNSISTMLLPSVAESNSNGNIESVKKTTEKSIGFSTVTGIFGIGLFLYFGDFIGTNVFGHSQAGTYIQVLSWLCPFLYLSVSFGSVLHGLGKTTAAFIHNVIGIIIRLVSIWWWVPRYGINAYLIGLLLSNVVTTLLHGFYLRHYIHYDFSPMKNIIKPIIQTFIGLTIGFFIHYIFQFSSYSGKIFDYCTTGIQFILVCSVFAFFLSQDFRHPDP